MYGIAAPSSIPRLLHFIREPPKQWFVARMMAKDKRVRTQQTHSLYLRFHLKLRLREMALITSSASLFSISSTDMARGTNFTLTFHHFFVVFLVPALRREFCSGETGRQCQQHRYRTTPQPVAGRHLAQQDQRQGPAGHRLPE
eukprot:GHVN01020300.1.p1 GENE.GHVN01020300.1~~GHVN01020300.1.p1  ORF type:complete len:143 (+),score=11.53 GHVN01020300.1:112-540(+)